MQKRRFIFTFIFNLLALATGCLISIHAKAQIRSKYLVSNEKCYGYPSIESLRYKNRCVGLVADKTTVAWSAPRKLLFDGDYLYVSATGGWGPGLGQLWRLQIINGALTSELLFSKLDRAHGLQKGDDGYIYVGEAKRIFRFHPQSPHKIENVITQLPDSYTDKKGLVTPSNHPLTEFIFLPSRAIVVNVGAPSNDCSEEFTTARACAQRDQQAEVRIYFYNETAQKYDLQYKVLARGLRNSMGLLYNESLNQIYQAENSADTLGTPDEVNLIDLNEIQQGRNYDFGWPFCYGYKNYLPMYKNFRRFCETRADVPYFLLPAHASPLDVRYYQGAMFPEFNNSILMSWHGHRPSGSKIAVFKTENTGLIQNTQPEFLMADWSAKPGLHPKGRPVGMAIDADGAIFVVDDINNTLMVIARDDQGANNTQSQTQTAQKAVQLTPLQLQQWNTLFTKTLKTMQCQTCHADVVTNNANQTLQNLFKVGWLVQKERADNQLLWIRMNGIDSRIMPPPPAPNLKSPSLTNTRAELYKWLMGL